MKTIRTKIIFILLLAVVIPNIPLSILVYQLVNRSYRIGVNSYVEQALENSVQFSKMLYDLQRRQLSSALNEMSRMNPESMRNRFHDRLIEIPSIIDSNYWQIISLHLVNPDGKILEKRLFSHHNIPAVSPLILKQFRETGQTQLIVSDRGKNLFTAVEKLIHSNNQTAFLVLQARLKQHILDNSDDLLTVRQMYQTLDLTRQSLMQSFLFAFMVIALILLTLTVVFGIWLSSRLTAPLSFLVKGTAEIGKGNLDFKLPARKGKDEFSKLFSHFNRMAMQLKENQEKLLYLEKVSAWKQMARKLAHEIKNPLTPIQLTVQQIVDKADRESPEYRQLLGECSAIINEELGSLRQLVTEFSEFGRLPELNISTGDINKLVQEVSALYKNRLTLELEPDLPELPFDHDRMRRVLINLIENAIQADPSHQPVTIQTKPVENGLQMIISDKGSGIPQEQLNKIFDPYFSTKKEGMGLGLAITRLIIEEHGGTIRVVSGINEGSRFTIELPVNS